MRIFWIVSALLLLTSCAPLPRSSLPPVIDSSTQAQRGSLPRDYGDAQAIPLPDDTTAEAIPLPDSAPYQEPAGNAVVALLERADQQTSAGEADAAAASLERALRIEPRNAQLWSRLATIRLEQGQPEQAEQIAMKSNSLSPHDQALQARNWDIVARARWARDDSTGARVAESQADRLRARR